MAIDPRMFDMTRLLTQMFARERVAHFNFGNVEVVKGYMPEHPLPTTQPRCVVRSGEWFLRHSKGPRQEYFWDSYGDDFLSPELAILALYEAPPVPMVKPYLEFKLQA